jgi:putative heme-binding domain-containing protein
MPRCIPLLALCIAGINAAAVAADPPPLSALGLEAAVFGGDPLFSGAAASDAAFRGRVRVGDVPGDRRPADGQPARDRSLVLEIAESDASPYRQGMAFRCRPDGGDFEVLIRRFRRRDAADAALAGRIDDAPQRSMGTPAHGGFEDRLRLGARLPALLAVASGDDTAPTFAVAAARAALEFDGGMTVLAWARSEPTPETARLLAAVGLGGTPAGLAILERLVLDAQAPSATRTAAVFAMGRCQQGAERLVAMASEGRLPGPLAQPAATAITMCPWRHVRQAAAGVLPMPMPRKGGSLPGIASLVKRSDGDPQRGRQVFFGAGTCSKCHVVEGEGRAVGPNLAGVGARLPPMALYESILAPSAAISPDYQTHTVLLDDGRSVTGLLVSRSPTELVIRSSDGSDTRVPADAIDELVRQPVSLMPSDLATALSAQDLVDLVAWLGSLEAAEPARP